MNQDVLKASYDDTIKYCKEETIQCTDKLWKEKARYNYDFDLDSVSSLISKNYDKRYKWLEDSIDIDPVYDEDNYYYMSNNLYYWSWRLNILYGVPIHKAKKMIQNIVEDSELTLDEREAFIILSNNYE
jgi:hypothetical protein